MENTSKFSFAVQVAGKKTAKTTEPELTATSTPGKIKINEAASRLLNLQSGDHLMFLSNKSDVESAVYKGDLTEEEAQNQIAWGIAKGNVIYGRDGNPVQVTKRLTKDEARALVESGEVDEDGNPIPQEEDKRAGSKLASPSGQHGVGNTLECSDTNTWNELNGDKEKLQVYSIQKEPVEVTVPNGTEEGEVVELYLIEFDRTENKSR